MINQSTAAQTPNELPSIDHIAAGLERQFVGLTHFVIDGRVSEAFSDTCPDCGEPASKCLYRGKVVFVHSVLMRAGEVVAASYHQAPKRREVFH